jgi:hypothetical protein
MRKPPDEYQREYPCEVPFRLLDESEKLTRGQQVILGVCIVAAGGFSFMVAHWYYVWMLQ